uniref:Uncharacterized protein n=1 Tax=Cacopsylla melanoneura TaxID=428564 RepID=A0A8D8Z925_9HEMI
MMDPLPLAVILHEGDGLADLNFQLELDLPQESFNYPSSGFGQSHERNTAKKLCNQTPLSGSIEYDVICYCFNCNVGFTHKMDPSHYEYERSGRCPLCDQTLQRRVTPLQNNPEQPISFKADKEAVARKSRNQLPESCRVLDRSSRVSQECTRTRAPIRQ